MGKQGEGKADGLEGKLTVAEVKALAKAGLPGMHGDGHNLWLRVTKTGSANWGFRYQLPGGRPREAGLGPLHTVSLQQARETAREYRQLVRAGKDPLVVREAEKPAPGHTFEAVATLYISAHEAGWRNTKHGAQWKATLASYAYPALGALDVAAVSVEDVLGVLSPIWRTKAETAKRVRGRIESVLGYAIALKWRTDTNPAAWSTLKALLPAKNKVSKTQHHAALGHATLPDFMAGLESKSALSASCLRFCVLTASRSGEARNAAWNEIDFQKRLWLIPASKMKSARDHRVPLSDQAIAILNEMLKLKTGESSFVFPGQIKNKPLSDVALNKQIPNAATVHGMRSTFRVWCAEKTNYPREVCEAALAHTLGSKVETAYMRSDLFDLRVKLMQDWADYIA
jgi:integrase